MAKRLYLQQLGLSWYLRVKVPAALQSRVGTTHIRRALGTRDLDEANRRKWPALAQVREYLDALSAGDTTQQPPASLRQIPGHAITPLPTPPNPDLRPHQGLDGLAEEWALTSNSKTTQFQRRQVYAQLRAFLGKNVNPESVTDAQAATFVDTHLAKSRYSPNTLRFRLSALRAFWSWMGSRRYAPRDRNPWKGFRLQSTEDAASQKRPYSMDELVTLFSGNPTYPTLREVMALGLYTGARIDEICSLTMGDVNLERGAALVRIAKSKTKAGVRTIAVAHAIPLEVIVRRYRKSASPKDQIFPELKGGGYDGKLSWHVGQAFRYHRNGRGLTGATDFHSLRRTFITRLENLGVDQVRIARYVGHSLPTLAFTVYSGGATEATQRATAQCLHYPPAVEKAVRNFLKNS